MVLFPLFLLVPFSFVFPWFLVLFPLFPLFQRKPPRAWVARWGPSRWPQRAQLADASHLVFDARREMRRDDVKRVPAEKPFFQNTPKKRENGITRESDGTRRFAFQQKKKTSERTQAQQREYVSSFSFSFFDPKRSPSRLCPQTPAARCDAGSPHLYAHDLWKPRSEF